MLYLLLMEGAQVKIPASFCLKVILQIHEKSSKWKFLAICCLTPKQIILLLKNNFGQKKFPDGKDFLL